MVQLDGDVDNADSEQYGSTAFGGPDASLAEGLGQVQRVVVEACSLIVDLLEAKRVEAAQMELRQTDREVSQWPMPPAASTATPPEPSAHPPKLSFADEVPLPCAISITSPTGTVERTALHTSERHAHLEVTPSPRRRTPTLEDHASRPIASPMRPTFEIDPAGMEEHAIHSDGLRRAGSISSGPIEVGETFSDGAAHTEQQHVHAAKRHTRTRFHDSDYLTSSSAPADFAAESAWENRHRLMDRVSHAVAAAKTATEDQDDDMETSSVVLGRGLFIDPDKVKENIRMSMRDIKTTRYRERGYAQAIAKSQTFETITLFITFMNVIWIAIETDLNATDVLLNAVWWVQFFEHFFCFFFTAELAIRVAAYADKKLIVKDNWLLFDGALVFFMILETWLLSVVVFLLIGDSQSVEGGGILRVLRLLRLARLGRLGRLLRRVPELLILIKGALVATRSVLCTLCLLLIVIYVFALVFRLSSKGTAMAQEGFNSVPESMLTLLVGGTLPDLEGIVMRVGRHGWFYSALLLVFVLLSSLTVLNMLVGVLVEVVQVVSAVEKEQMEVDFVRNQLEKLVTSMDEDGDRKISKEEFHRLIENPVAIRCLTNISVDVVGLVDFTDFIFGGTDNLTFQEFMDILLSLRGSQKATVRDIVDLRKVLVQELMHLDRKLNRTASIAVNGRRSAFGDGMDDYTHSHDFSGAHAFGVHHFGVHRSSTSSNTSDIQAVLVKHEGPRKGHRFSTTRSSSSGDSGDGFLSQIAEES